MTRSKTRRGRPLGRPPKISRQSVVSAGVEIGLESVTIQAVADHLAVSRTAVYSYVTSSDELRRLVANATLTEFEVDPDEPSDWQDWIRHVAVAGREWRLANAPAEPYMSVTDIELGGFLVVVERTLAVLDEAGFDPPTAARALEFLSGVVWINTQDQLVAEATADGTHPQQQRFNEAGMDRLAEYPRLQRGIERDEFLGAFDARFDFEIRGVIAALEAELERSHDQVAS